MIPLPHTAQPIGDLEDLKDSEGQLGPAEMRKAPGKKKRRHSSKRSGHTKRPGPFREGRYCFSLERGVFERQEDRGRGVLEEGGRGLIVV